MDWIHPWIGMNRIGLGFSGNFMDLIGLNRMTVVPLFYRIIKCALCFISNQWSTVELQIMFYKLLTIQD